MDERPLRFWPLLGAVVAADVGLVVLYTLLSGRWSRVALSDHLCASSLLLGVATALPVVLDAGRGAVAVARAGHSRETMHAALREERQRRWQGATFSFALAAAAVVAALLSLLLLL